MDVEKRYVIGWMERLEACINTALRCVFLFSVHAIVATPGRILDLMNKNLVKIGKCGILVLDEVTIKK